MRCVGDASRALSLMEARAVEAEAEVMPVLIISATHGCMLMK